MSWIWEVSGLSGHGAWNAFWGGIGSDLGEVGIFLGIAATVRKHTCHVKHCWRVGRHPVAGTLHIVCAKHHPDDPPTHEQLLAQVKELRDV